VVESELVLGPERVALRRVPGEKMGRGLNIYSAGARYNETVPTNYYARRTLLEQLLKRNSSLWAWKTSSTGKGV